MPMTALEDAAVAYVDAMLTAKDTARGPSMDEIIAVEVTWHDLIVAAGRCTCEAG